MPRQIVINSQVGDMPTAIAHLLGYIPSPGSVALLGFVDNDTDAATVIDASATPSDQWPHVIADVADVVAQRGWEILLLAYGDNDTVGDRPYEALQALASRGIAVKVAARLHDQRLYCLRCSTCAINGVPARPSRGLMALLRRAGFHPAPDRQTYARGFELAGPADQLRMKLAADAAAARLVALIPDPHMTPAQAQQAIAKAGIGAVDDAIAATRHQAVIPDSQAAWLLLMLAHLPARDHAAFATTETPLALLWQELLCRAPVGLQSAPACLLATAAILDGDTALAERALARCLADDPRYGLAHILAEAIDVGVPVGDLRAGLRKFKLEPDD